jgi:alpha-beta hydrolase superfamily lysophospholipase
VAHCRFWPATAPVGWACLYLHGIQSHGGWYEWSASVLADASGAAVLALDRRGSGLNSAARGDAPRAERWLRDLDEHADWLGQRSGAAQLGVVGVSWGGKLALAWMTRGRRVDDWLLIAPGVFPKVGVSAWERARIAAALLLRPDARFEIPLNDPVLFTEDPAGQSFVAGDPLRLTHATARLLYQSSRLDRWLKKTIRLAGRGTLILAEGDRIIRNSATERWLQTRSELARIERLPGSHTLEFERDRDGFERTLREWAARGRPTRR